MAFTKRPVARPGSTAYSRSHPPGVAQNKIGFPANALDRNVALQPAPATTQGHSDSRTQVYTYFTAIQVAGQPTPILYNGDRQWVTVTLELETAGPVAVGTQSNMAPVLSGKGQLLETNEPKQFVVAKGTRLYILSESVNRVKVTIEPLPWLEQFAGLLGSLDVKMKP